MSRPATKVVAPQVPRKRRKAQRRAQADRREEAQAAILDAAERLFAEHGRDGVTLRMVAAAAKVDSALVHYYFDDLEGVFRQVFLRKSAVINPIRAKAMDDYLATHGGRPTIEGALEALVRPVLETVAADPKYWSDYAAIIAEISASHYAARRYAREGSDDIVNRFSALLFKMAPDVPRAEIFWYGHLLSGAIQLTLAQTGRIDILSGGLCKSTDLGAAIEPLVRLYSAGFEALRARYGKKK